MELAEQVYETLLNTLGDGLIHWVRPIFVPGNPCFEAYSDMHRACERLRERLDAADEDPDVEEIIEKLLAHGKIVAMEMFACGMYYQRIQNEEKPGA